MRLWAGSLEAGLALRERGVKITSSARKRKQMVWEKDDDDWKRAQKSS